MSVQPVAAPVDPRHVTPCEIEQYGIFKEKNNERNREVCKSVNKLFDNLIQDPQMQKESLRNAYYALDESKIMHSKWRKKHLIKNEFQNLEMDFNFSVGT